MSEVVELSPKIRLVIDFDPQTGAVNLSGPIENKLLCYGLLELAKECIQNHAKQQKNQILVARPALRV